jgi:Alpha-glutamyl/putrescinyl thymine pyrophosphorylase clade 3
VPTFCRHNRFIDRCPICSKTLVELSPSATTKPRRAATKGAPIRSRHPGLRADLRSVGGREVRVHRESRAADDGYRSVLLPGLRASGDALALAEEIAFAQGRLLALGATPPGLYAEVRTLAAKDIEQATWMCFLIAYLSPLEGDDPFAGIRAVLAGARDGGAYEEGGLGDLDGIPLGPRTSHDPARGASTLLAYHHWAERAGGQAHAFEGEPAWSPQRRFERCFERLALPGLGRMGRYDLLVTLGGLDLYELRADSLHFISANESSTPDLATLAAKRVFAIGDPLNLERRARALAEAISVPVEVLEVALWNWSPPAPGVRATLGFPSETCDPDALQRSRDALEL